MPFVDDFVTAVNTYAKDKAQLSIVDKTPVPPYTGPGVNVSEVWSFAVQILNVGHLNMTGVKVDIEGKNGTKVSTAATGPWSSSLSNFGNLTVNANLSQKTPKLYFRAPTVPHPDAPEDLVEAHIGSFDVNLNHILNDHTGHSDPPFTMYSDKVYPS